MRCACGRLSGKQHQSCFSQGSAATLFRLGCRFYNFLMCNFLKILYVKNYENRFIFRRVIWNKKGAFFETRCSIWKTAAAAATEANEWQRRCSLLCTWVVVVVVVGGRRNPRRSPTAGRRGNDDWRGGGGHVVTPALICIIDWIATDGRTTLAGQAGVATALSTWSSLPPPQSTPGYLAARRPARSAAAQIATHRPDVQCQTDYDHGK